MIGFELFNLVARPILDLYGYGSAYAAFQAKFQEYGLWIILIKGLTPIPYKIVTIAAGAARFDFWLFMMASVLTRGVRFFMVATLLHFFGDTVRDFIEQRLTLVTSVLALGVVGGFLALKAALGWPRATMPGPRRQAPTPDPDARIETAIVPAYLRAHGTVRGVAIIKLADNANDIFFSSGGGLCFVAHS